MNNEYPVDVVSLADPLWPGIQRCENYGNCETLSVDRAHQYAVQTQFALGSADTSAPIFGSAVRNAKRMPRYHEIWDVITRYFGKIITHGRGPKTLHASESYALSTRLAKYKTLPSPVLYDLLSF